MCKEQIYISNLCFENNIWVIQSTHKDHMGKWIGHIQEKSIAFLFTFHEFRSDADLVGEHQLVD